MVIYTYSGKIEQSSYVISYKKKHTCVHQSKRYRKMASVPELKQYTDQVLVYNQKYTCINWFIDHSIPTANLINSNVEYQVVND